MEKDNRPRMEKDNRPRMEKDNRPRLVVAGAYYFAKHSRLFAKYINDDEILKPHYTGEFWVVDCDKYITKEELEDTYDKKYIDDNKDNYLVYEDEKYFYAEFGPRDTDGMELLSDLTDLRHVEGNFDF